MTAIAIHNQAVSWASRVKADSILNTTLANEIERREESKRTPLYVMSALETEFGDSLFDLPEPDSGPEGNNPDKYEETIPNSKRTRKGSFWKDFFLGLPFVSKHATELEKVKKAAGAFTNKASDVPADLAYIYKQGPAWVEAEKKMLSARVNAAVNVGYQGIRLVWQMRHVSEYPNVEIELAMNDDGSDIQRRTNPIIIFELFPEKTSEDKPHPKAGQRTGMLRYFSVGEFLALRPKKAEENGGTFEALWRSAKREVKTPDLSANVQTPDTFSEYLASQWYFTQKPKAYDQMVNYFLNEENNDALLTAYHTEMFLDKVLGNKAVRSKIDKLLEADNASAKAA